MQGSRSKSQIPFLITISLIVSTLIVCLVSDVDAQKGRTRRGSKAKKSAGKSKVGDVKKNSMGIEFVWIPPGETVIGSPLTEWGRGNDEDPQLKAKIAVGFWLGRFEVTQGQWESVMGDNPSHFSECGPGCPVETVSWDDAKEFISRLNQRKDGLVYSLPTEAEWEYAARAGTTTVFAFGNTLESTQANFDGTAQYANYTFENFNTGPNLGKTVKVGSYQPNRWGLYDMHGNVWEWVQDRYRSTYGKDSKWQDKRVLRGGSWTDPGIALRSANRLRELPTERSKYFGFRVAARQAN